MTAGRNGPESDGVRPVVKSLSDYGLSPRLATPEQLQAILFTVQCGIADPTVVLLLEHAAALTEDCDRLRRLVDERTAERQIPDEMAEGTD